MRRLVALAGVVTMTALPVLLTLPAEAQQAAGCRIMHTLNVQEGPTSRVSLIDLPAATEQPLPSIGYWVNALGYSAAQDLVYGIADGDKNGRFHDGGHVLTIARTGKTADLGPVRKLDGKLIPWSVVTGATAGAIVGNRWYIRKEGNLYTVDVDPVSPNYLAVLKRTSLRPITLAIGVDDFDYNPADGLLYGISTSFRAKGAVVTIDPATGLTKTVPSLPQLPAGTAYGALVLGPDGTIYTTANRIGNRSVLFRVGRDGSVNELATGPALVSSDAAGCLTNQQPRPDPPSPPPAPPEPPSPPSETPAPPPPPSTSEPAPPEPEPPAPPPPAVPPPAAPPPVERPPVVPPPVPTPTPPPPPAPPLPPPVAKKPYVVPKTSTLAVKRDQRTQQKRRVVMTTLVLILGSAAAGHAIRRAR